VSINRILVAVITWALATGMDERLALEQTSAETGALRGIVTLEDTNKPVHGVSVSIIQLRRSTIASDQRRRL
jgi:hypothetical protein